MGKAFHAAEPVQARFSHSSFFRLASIFAGTLAMTGCFDEFRGSLIQIQIGPFVPAQAKLGETEKPGQIPHNAHFSLVAFSEKSNEQGQVTTTSAFALTSFEIVPAVDNASPCFIDADPRSKLRGVHVTKFFERIAVDTGISDIKNPPESASETDKIDAATAAERVRRAGLYATDLKAVTSASPIEVPALGSLCSVDPGFDTSLIPPIRCFDDESNKVRLRNCEAFWSAHPDFYQGNDSILSSPLNGTSFGFAVGRNPVNLTPIGGASIFIDEVIADFDSFAINWQYDDADGDGAPDYPASVPANERSKLGQPYMFGRPRSVTRGTRYVSLQSSTSQAIKAEMTFITNLGEDNVNF
jgi:hypothetical protein